MNRFLLSLFFLCCTVLHVLAQDPVLHAIASEPYAWTGLPGVDGKRTYSFYLELANPGDQLTSLYASAGFPISISCTGDVVSSNSGVFHGGAFLCTDLEVNASLRLDPFLTIGVPNDCTFGDAGTWDFVDPTQADLANQVALFPGSVQIEEATLAVFDGHVAGQGDAQNRIFVGQFTASAEVALTLNCTVIPSGETDPVSYTGIASLMLATGCTDPAANNYDLAALEDNGTCTFGPLKQIQVLDITPEDPPEGYPIGYTTYLLQAQMADITSRVSAVFASEGNTLHIQTPSAEIWGHEFGDVVGSNLNALLFEVYPNLPYDSFLTVGALSNDDAGSVITAAIYPSASVFIESFGVESGVDLYCSDGAWFTFSDNAATASAENDAVVLAQITTQGALYYGLNLQIITEEGVDIRYAHSPPPGSEDILFGSGYTLSNMPDSVCLNPAACNFAGTLPHVINDEALCEFTSCTGCTDPAATNYDYLAVINEACVFPCEIAVVTNEWQCAYDVDLEQVTYTLQLELEYDDENCSLTDACLTLDEGDPVCYNFGALGVTPNGEGTSIELPSTELPEGQYVISFLGGGEIIVPVEVGVDITSCIAGCTDVEASNFVPLASLDDGSCVYNCPPETPNRLYFEFQASEFYAATMGIEIHQTLNAASEDLLLSHFGLENLELITDSLCVADGCLLVTMYDGNSANGWEDGFYTLSDQTQQIALGTMTSGDVLMQLIEVNSDCPIAGCTDSSATNWNENATFDDNGCEYETEGPPSPEPIGDEVTWSIVNNYDEGSLTISMGGLEVGANMSFQVIDATLRRVEQFAIAPRHNSEIFTLATSYWATGFYVILIQQGDRFVTIPIFKS